MADADLEQRQTEGHGAFGLGAGLHNRPKIKPATTLDLVILAAEWDHGRRTGWLRSYDCRRRVLMIWINLDPL